MVKLITRSVKDATLTHPSSSTTYSLLISVTSSSLGTNFCRDKYTISVSSSVSLPGDRIITFDSISHSKSDQLGNYKTNNRNPSPLLCTRITHPRHNYIAHYVTCLLLIPSISDCSAAGNARTFLGSCLSPVSVGQYRNHN